jgi:flavin reductase (DIM6/NTAB) family NADH-FMN oxidoreductase RutF
MAQDRGEWLARRTMTMDETAKKEALRLFTYGLFAITCAEGEQRNAFTANWLSQVSFDPPLVALSVENTSTSIHLIRASRRFAVNVFGAEQRALSGRLGKNFAKDPAKLDGLRWAAAGNRCPVLEDTVAWVACDVESETPAGDSTVFIGRVVDAAVLRREEPLTMLAAGFKHAG